MIISLTGFMGCGKSSVGRRLSQLLCCPFMDLDDVIVEAAGRTIREIFESEGEVGFRQMELETLKAIVESRLSKDKESPTFVLALGGGAVMTEECAEIVREQTCCIYLRTSLETLMERLADEAEGRPMLSNRPLHERISELMALRSETYEKTAHIIIDTDGKSIGAIASEIVGKNINQYNFHSDKV